MRENNNKKIQKNAFQIWYNFICILLSQIIIWPLRKTSLSTYISLLIIPCMIVYVTNNKEPWTLLAITEVRHFLLATRFAHISGVILSNSFLQILYKSLRFWGWRLATRTFSCLHRFFMGLRSKDWLAHSRAVMCFFLSLSYLGRVFWVIFMLKCPSRTRAVQRPLEGQVLKI